jgi:Protein of unknown function (DUF1071)
MENSNPFIRLASIDVSQHIEKKSNLSYLSWAWAVDQLMRADPAANWEFHEPTKFGNTMMVSCTVTAFGKPVKMHLPVMDHKNKAVENPDAFVVNKNMMRCLVKAIACHGLGLYIYAGEDLPADEEGNVVKPPRPQRPPQQRPPAHQEAPQGPETDAAVIATHVSAMDACRTLDTLKDTFAKAWKATRGAPAIKKAYDTHKSLLENPAPEAA